MRSLFQPIVVIAVLCGCVAAAGKSPPPNIVLILADDLGWSDLGCQGADLIETPRIDRMASEGVRFTQAYAMSVCSPTRAMLLTGRHAARLGLTIWIEKALRPPTEGRFLEAVSHHDLPLSETTLATRLRDAGYLTALIGKWHLGGDSFHPEAHGFDINIGGTHWGAPATHWWPFRGKVASRATAIDPASFEVRYVPGLGFGQSGDYLADRLTDEALRVIDAAQGRPFFLYIPQYAVHIPAEAKPADIDHFAAKLRPEMRHQNATYAAMVRNLDENVGRVLDHLQKRGLDRNTIVIFASDNGGFIGVGQKQGPRAPVTNNAPLRSGKGSLYEGGIRVPLIIRWPGLTAPGGECDQPVSLADLFPTLVGQGAGDNVVLDGVDLTPLLRNPAARIGRDALFFHYPHYYATTKPVSAVRAGDWKLLEYLEDGRLELYNLRRDPSENLDLASVEPQRAAALRARLDQWRHDVGARMPMPNPNFKAQ